MRDGRRPHRWRLRADELLTACAAELERFSEEAVREGQEATEALRRLQARSRAPHTPPPSARQALEPASSALPAQLPPDAEAALPPTQRAEEVAALPSSANVGSMEAPAASDGDMSAVVGLLEALAHDNTVMECNLRDYTAACAAVLREAVRLKAEQEAMEKRVWLVDQLQNLVNHEEQVRLRLTEESEELSASVAGLREALASALGPLPSQREDETLCLVEDLAEENAILRRFLLGTPAAMAEDARASNAADPAAPTATA